MHSICLSRFGICSPQFYFIFSLSEPTVAKIKTWSLWIWNKFQFILQFLLCNCLKFSLENCSVKWPIWMGSRQSTRLFVMHIFFILCLNDCRKVCARLMEHWMKKVTGFGNAVHFVFSHFYFIGTRSFSEYIYFIFLL